MAAVVDEKAPRTDVPTESFEDTTSGSDRDLDETYRVYKATEQLEATESEAKKVLRKIDMRVVPILFVTYMLQYLDKNSLNFSSVYGLQDGTNLHGQDYSWLGSIFYFGYLIAQFPASFLLQRLPIGKFVSATTILWGIILMTTPGCTSFAGIATNRFLLGFTEAAINPAFVWIMSIWYTNSEQPLRLEAYYCTNGLATMFGGLIGYAVGHITTGLPRWMYVFLIFGALSTAWGVVSFLVLPDTPATAKFLTDKERAIATGRVAQNRQGVKNHHFKREQAVQCFTDPKTWILFVMATGAQVPNAAITSFTSLIVKSFGFDTLGTQYLQIPGGAVQFLALIIGGYVCTKWPNNSRCITMIVANLICILGAALLVGLPDSNKWGRLVALWLCYFQGLGFSMSLTMISSNIAGSTKKQLTAAVLFTGYCVGNIIGPQTFIDSEAPGYHSAYIAMLVGYVVKLLSIVVLYLYMWRENKRRDAAGFTDEKNAIEAGMHDLTELDNKGFSYHPIYTRIPNDPSESTGKAQASRDNFGKAQAFVEDSGETQASGEHSGENAGQKKIPGDDPGEKQASGDAFDIEQFFEEDSGEESGENPGQEKVPGDDPVEMEPSGDDSAKKQASGEDDKQQQGEPCLPPSNTDHSGVETVVAKLSGSGDLGPLKSTAQSEVPSKAEDTTMMEAQSNATLDTPVPQGTTKSVHWPDDIDSPSGKKAKYSSAEVPSDILPQIADYNKALMQTLGDVKRELEKSKKISEANLDHFAPRIQALYHCFNRHYLLLRIGQLAREFATAANTFDLPGSESTNEQAMQSG